MDLKKEKKDGFWETLKTIIWALLIAMVFRSAFYQPFSIPSGSMKSGLRGDRGGIAANPADSLPARQRATAEALTSCNSGGT